MRISCLVTRRFLPLLVVVALSATLVDRAAAQVAVSGSFDTRFPQQSLDVARTLNRAYVASSLLGEVHVVDLDTHTVLGVLGTNGGSGEAALSPNEEWVFVAGSGRDHLLFRTSDNLLDSTFQLGDFNGELTLGVGWSPDSRYAFALRVESSPSEASILYRVDVQTFDVEQVEVGGLVIFARGFLFMAPGGSRAIVRDTFSSPNAVRVIDTDSMTILAELDLGAGPADVEFEATGRRAYIAMSGEDHVAVLNLDTLAVERTIPTSDRPGTLSIDEATGRLAVLCNGQTDLYDVTTGTLLTSTPTPGAGSVILQPYVGTALVTIAEHDEVRVLDFDPASPTFGDLLQTLPLPECTGNCDPTSIELHPDGRQAFVLSFNRLRVDVLDLPDPDVSVYVTPSAFAYEAGDRVEFTVTLVNHTNQPQSVTGWVDVLKPNGNPFGANPVVGPITKQVGALRTITKTVGYRIGNNVAPAGPFQTIVRLGTPPLDIEYSSGFPFFVTTP